MGVIYPACDEAYGTEGGMKRHHYYSHNESIAEKECRVCSKGFDLRSSFQMFCGRECSVEWKRVN